MPLSPGLRRLSLTVHVVSSVGWLGAIVAYLALAVVGLRGGDGGAAVYPAMQVLGWYVLVPFCLAALVAGVVQGLGTVWGLVRYYWVAAKLLLTLVASIVLLLRAEDFFGPQAARGAGLPPLGVQLVVHATGGLLVLLAATALSVYKPWGRTPYGQRKLEEGRGTPRSSPAPSTVARRRVYVVLGALALLLLLAALHLTMGGRGAH